MSDPRIDAISAALSGAPEDLIKRSAAARAEAQGATLDDVLSVWSGGGELQAASSVAETAVSSEEAAPEPTSTPSATESSAPATMAQGAIGATAVAVMEADTYEDVETVVDPAALGARVQIGAKLGALVGGLLGIVAIVATLPALLNRLSLPAGESTPAVEVTALAAVLTIAGFSAAFGAIITLVCRGVSSFVSAAFETDASSRGGVFLGGFAGLVLGFIAGGVLLGSAEATLTSTKLLPVRSLVFTVLIGGVILGAITGALAQGLAQPSGLRGEAADDAATVKRRLSDSMMIPLVSSIIILVIVVSLGSLLVRYPSYASIVAILVALGILSFASLMASRPNLRITRGEVLTAGAGVGVVLLMIALVAAQTSDGSHGDEGESHSVSEPAE